MNETPIHERRLVYQIPGMDEVKVQHDITYTNVEGTELKLDVYTPPNLSANIHLPGVVFIHGGPVPVDGPLPTHWGQYRSWGELIAASGLVGVTLCHRYHNYTCLEQANSDITTALNYIRKHAEEFNLDPDHLGVWACSGGGPFLGPIFQNQPKFVRCIISYYAILDLRPFKGISQVVTGELIDKFSPVVQLGSTEVPMFIVRAGLDRSELNQTIDLFIQKALSLNAPFDFVNHARGHHAFDILDNDARSREIIIRTIEFIKANV